RTPARTPRNSHFPTRAEIQMSYRLWRARRSLISKPKKFADRPHPRCRDIASASSDCPKNACFLWAAHEKCDAPAAFDYRVSHGDADFGPAVRHCRDPSLAFLEHGFTWK